MLKCSAAFPSLCSIVLVSILIGNHADAEDGDQWYYLSNDGDAALLMRTPDYYSVPNREEHLAIIPHKTPVEVLESRRDRSLSILNWSKVKILAGQHRGKIGWVSSRNVIATTESRPPEEPPADPSNEARGQRRVTRSSELSTAKVVTATQLRKNPKVSSAESSAPQLSAGTRLEIQLPEAQKDDFGLEFQWWFVEVLDGEHKGKDGWILDQHITIERPKLPYNSEKAFAYAAKFCSAGNECTTGEYNSFSNPITLLANPTSTDCTHFMSHVLQAGGVTVKGSKASCESGLAIRVVELKTWFRQAAKKYSNVREIASWEDAQKGDYCFLGDVDHVVLLASQPKSDRAGIYAHANNRCGDEVKFNLAICTFFRIEDYSPDKPQSN
jgi:hypothetical protein